MQDIESVTVFCGASVGDRPDFMDAARRLGQNLARAKIQLVYGGGHSGSMGAVADGATDAGGHVIGIIPDFLKNRELAAENISELITVDSMHSRKQKMFELSDGFIILPGGVGTLEEAFEVITWRQLGMHDKPIVVVNVLDYWAKLDEIVASIVEHEFAAPPTRDLYHMVDDVDQVVETIRTLPRGRIEVDPARL